MSETIFAKIINREIPAEIIFEDDLCLACKDVNPQAPIHVLVIPKKPISKLTEASDDDRDLLGHMLLKIKHIVDDLGCTDACRVVINNGANAGQSVFHLHLHVLAGRPFSWPPG